MSDYNFIYQFDGNLTDDTGQQVLSVDSGTPAYVTGDNGQALIGNSASLTTVFPPKLFNGNTLHFVLNFRVNTGATDGVILSLETNDYTIMQVALSGTGIEIVSYTGAQAGAASSKGTETYPLDAWAAFGWNMGSSTTYRELEPGTTGVSYTQYYDDWDETEYGPDVTLTIGAPATTNTTNAGTVTATGVDIDFLTFDNWNEGYPRTAPLGYGFDPRVNPVYPTNNVSAISDAVSATSVISTGSVVATSAKVYSGGGSGGGGPVIKEFWS